MRLASENARREREEFMVAENARKIAEANAERERQEAEAAAQIQKEMEDKAA